MFLSRKFGKLLRGKVTPYQVLAACLLGSLLGFMPGFAQAAGLIVFFTALLIILNANLFLAAFVGVFGKGVSILVMPLSFAVGRFLLEGPTEGLFRAMVNAPVLALFGFEYYVTTGAVVLGGAFGVLLGIVVVLALKAFWKKMASFETGSERYRRWSEKKWVGVLTYVFLGLGKGTLKYEDVMKKKLGNPIRTLGVVLVVMLGVLGFVIHLFASELVTTYVAQRGLERANGATVDLASAELKLREGRLTLTGLAMADPQDLGTDIFRADTIESDIRVRDLLRKRVTMDRVLVQGGRQGAERRVPGVLVGPQPTPAPEPETEEGERSIEEMIEQARLWKERLAQVRRWIERISGPEEEPEVTPEGEEIPPRETRRERIAREILEKGYDGVVAEHLLEGAPALLIVELFARDVRVAALEEETVDIEGYYLSTHPRLVKESPRVYVRSSAERLLFDLVLGRAAAMTTGNTLVFHYRDIPSDSVARHIAFSGKPLFHGGFIDIAVNGVLNLDDLHLPLRVDLRNTTLDLPGVGENLVEAFTLPIGVRGPLDNPRILWDEEQLTDALVAAGRAELAGRVRRELDDRLGSEIQDRLGPDVEERTRGLLDRFRGASGE